MRWLILFCLLLACDGDSCTPISSDGGSLTTPSGAPYYWDSYAFPIPLHVDSTQSKEFRNAIRDSVSHWEEITGEDLFTINLVSPNALEVLGIPMRGVIGVSISELGKNMSGKTINGQNETTLYRDDLGGDMGRIYGCIVYLDEDLKEEDYLAVMIHELGHALTLDHDENEDSLMYYAATKDPDATITQEDIERVRRMKRNEL